MAKAVINLQKESGGIVKISPVDGIGITEVTVPESGELATVDYVKNNGDINSVTSFSQISGTNTIEGVELTNNIHDVFGDGSAVATYQLNGNANDLGGTHNGTATNVTYEDGKFGQAAVFDRSTQKKITAPNYLIGDWNTGSKSVSLWVKTTNNTDILTLFTETTNAYNRGYGILTYRGGNFILGYHQTQGSASNQTQHSANRNIADGEWHHIIVSGNDSGIQIFVDNVSLNVTKVTGTSSSNNNPDYKFKIGAWEVANTNYSFDGLIDQVRIFNRALTASEINTLYSETKVSSNTKLNINQGTFIYPKGLTPRGYVKSSDTFTGTVPTSGVSDGWKYIAKDENNNFSFYTTKPTLGKTSAELYLKDGKLYKSSDDTEITPISFLSNKVRFASGIPLELAPSGIAKSVTETIEAKEVFGKNSILAYALIDMTATPPTILDSYNVSSVTRISNGVGKVILEVPTDKNNVTAICSSNAGTGSVTATTKSEVSFATAATNQTKTVVIVMGGKN